LRPEGTARAGEILQEVVEGRLASASFAADGRRAVVLAFAAGLAGDPAFGATGFRYCGSLFPYRVDPVAAAKMEAVAQAATRAFGLRGLNGIDFIVRDDGEPFVLELNPRYGASLELFERATGASAFEIHAAACRGRLPTGSEWRVRAAETLGKAVVWARRALVARDTREWLARDDVRDVPHPGERIPKGYPVCTVFARGATVEACRARLVEAAAAVERTIETVGAEVPA
jgi:predicted ATP-grasp superfamily ATP-dependent carboligase